MSDTAASAADAQAHPEPVVTARPERLRRWCAAVGLLIVVAFVIVAAALPKRLRRGSIAPVDLAVMDTLLVDQLSPAQLRFLNHLDQRLAALRRAPPTRRRRAEA